RRLARRNLPCAFAESRTHKAQSRPADGGLFPGAMSMGAWGAVSGNADATARPGGAPRSRRFIALRQAEPGPFYRAPGPRTGAVAVVDEAADPLIGTLIDRTLLAANEYCIMVLMTVLNGAASRSRKIVVRTIGSR